MSKERQKKLKGRDFTALLMIEVLEMFNFLSHNEYRMLEIARKARNKWAHDLRHPHEREVNMCLQVLQSLVFRVLQVPLALQGSARGGVPLWPTWMWDQMNASSSSDMGS